MRILAALIPRFGNVLFAFRVDLGFDHAKIFRNVVSFSVIGQGRFQDALTASIFF